MPYTCGQLLPSASAEYLSNHKELYHYESYFNWHLNSHGKKRDNCGTFSRSDNPNKNSSIIACKEHYKLQYKIIKYSCYKAECPICNRKWALREAETATNKILVSLKIFKRAGKKKVGNVRHIVFSPPQSFAKDSIKTLEGYRKLKKKAIKLIRKCGIWAGCVVFHAYRFNKTHKYWYISPHFHVVGIGYLLKSNIFYEKTGWIYRNYKKRKTLLGTISYELNHCGFWQDDGVIKHHLLTWFGELSYIKFKMFKKEPKYFPIKCKICKKPFRYVKSGFILKDNRINDFEYEFETKFDKKNIKFGEIYYIKKIHKIYAYNNMVYESSQLNFDVNLDLYLNTG